MYLSRLFCFLVFVFLYNSAFCILPEKAELTPHLVLNKALLTPTEPTLKEDPFSKHNFLKTVNISGGIRIHPAYFSLDVPDNFLGLGSNSEGTFNDNPNSSNGFLIFNDGRKRGFTFASARFSTANINISARLSRTVNVSSGFAVFSQQGGFSEYTGDNADNRAFNNAIRMNPTNIAFNERTSIGSFTLRVSSNVQYYSGVLTLNNIYGNVTQNPNFRYSRYDFFSSPRPDFNLYERAYQSSSLSSSPEVNTTGIFLNQPVSGAIVRYQSNRSGITSVLFAGVNGRNNTLYNRGIQVLSTSFLHRVSKEIRVNVGGKRATHEVGVNNMATFGYDNFINGQPVSYYVHSATLNARTNANGNPLTRASIQPTYEFALFREVTPDENDPSKKETRIAKGIILGHAFSGSLVGLNNFDMKLNLYHIDSGFTNPNGGFVNTHPDAPIRRDEFITPVDWFANNRQGLNLQLSYEFKDIFNKNDRLRIITGNEVSRQIKNPTATRFMHTISVNALDYSRSLVGGSTGPDRLFAVNNENALTVFINREDLDSDNSPIEKLHFSSFEGDIKYLGKINNKNFYAQTLFLCYSSQPDFSLLPNMSEQSLFRSYTVSLELYYEVIKRIVPNLFLGYERVKGNNQTSINSSTSNSEAPTFKPMDLINQGLGLGLDFNVNRDFQIAFRHKWFAIKNDNFPGNSLNGWASSIKLLYNFRVR